jgi:hypothetical protein
VLGRGPALTIVTKPARAEQLTPYHLAVLRTAFDHDTRFSGAPGYSFIRGKNWEPALQVRYEFPGAGPFRVACKVRHDMGGGGMWTGRILVE